MIKKLILENFMSHRYTELDLSEGLTVLIGPNNSGKSAVAAALASLCENESAKWAIRHGAREARVTAITADANRITWIRRETGSSYLINGEEHDRLRGSVPAELHQLLKLPPVTLEGENDVNIHFADQKNPVFEVLKNSGVAAGFFASSSDASRLLEMQRLHKEKTRDRRNELKSEIKHLESLQHQEECLLPIEAIDHEFTVLSQAIKQLEVDEKWKEGLKSSLSNFEALGANIGYAKKTSHTLSELIAPPEIQATESLEKLILELEQRQSDVKHAEKKCGALNRFRKFPEFEDELVLSELAEQLSHWEQQEEEGFVRLEALTKLKDVPETTESFSLCEMIDRLENGFDGYFRFEQEVVSLDALKDLPELSSDESLIQYIERIEDREKQQIELRSQSIELHYQLTEVREELESLVKQQPECPLCGQPVDANQLLGKRV